MNSKYMTWTISIITACLAFAGCAAPLKLIPFNQEGYSEDDPLGVKAIRTLEVKVAETPAIVTNIVNGKLNGYVSKDELKEGIVMNELDITVNDIRINGKAPSMEGHTHKATDIVDWDQVEFEVPVIEVKEITVDGKNVSLEGHGHQVSEIKGLPGFVTNPAISNAALVAIQSINNSTNILEMQEALTKFLMEFAK